MPKIASVVYDRIAELSFHSRRTAVETMVMRWSRAYFDGLQIAVGG